MYQVSSDFDFLKMCKPVDDTLNICISHKSKYLKNDVKYERFPNYHLLNNETILGVRVK